MAIALDVFGTIIVGYLFFCLLYYMFRPTSTAATNATKKNIKNKNNVAKIKDKSESSMGSVLINQMQIVALLLSSITWHPDIPLWLVNILTFLGDIFSIDFTGLLSSPDCMGGSMNPLNKWLLGIILPWCLASLFLLWYGFARCFFERARDKEYDAQVVETILQSAVQVLLIGLYTTVVKMCFKIFDCTTGGLLIMAPTYLCKDVLVYQIIGGIIFIFWAIVPFTYIGIRLCRSKKNNTLEKNMLENARFRILYGWAISKYKVHNSRVAYLWEIFNAFVKISMAAGSEMMYGPPMSSNRTIVHACTIASSLLLHGLVRPYKDEAGNIVVMLFCAVDLLGIFSTGSVGIQIIYIVATLQVLLVVLTLAIRELKATLDDQMSNRHKSKNENEFTEYEKKLLCPFLIIVGCIKAPILCLCRVKDVIKHTDNQSGDLRSWSLPSATGTDIEEDVKTKMSGGLSELSNGSVAVIKKKKHHHHHHHHHKSKKDKTKVVPI